MIKLIRPILFTFVNSPQVKRMIIDLLRQLVKDTGKIYEGNRTEEDITMFVNNNSY